MTNKTIKAALLVCTLAFAMGTTANAFWNSSSDFASSFNEQAARTWIGPEYWANPLQDWQLANGRIECIAAGGNRSIYLLTRELADKNGDIEMSVRLGRLETDTTPLKEGWVGFKLGVLGDFGDYRSNAVHGIGLPVGITTDGRLFIGNPDKSAGKIETGLRDLTLKLTARPQGGSYHVEIAAIAADRSILAREGRNVDASWLQGGFALACSSGKFTPCPLKRPKVGTSTWVYRPGSQRGGSVRFWFRDWKISGSKVRKTDDQAWGPILFCQYTLSSDTLKMTAQMPPMGPDDSNTVKLQLKQLFGWKTIATEKIHELARTATFKVTDWKSTKSHQYRLVYSMLQPNGKAKDCYFHGTIRKEPLKKEEIVVAGFSCMNDPGFPHNKIFEDVKSLDPDLLYYAGDQIYEPVAGFGLQAKPLDKACLDYLRKWYLHGWTWGKLTCDRPTISIPDDHDVYHGNLWGCGGKATTGKGFYAECQDSGGFKMPAAWVNMVQRTQTSNLPAPYDPTPALQGIGVYYTSFNYGGISFAIAEDRKFKSAPKPLLPNAQIWNGWAMNPQFNPAFDADVAGATLLGERQLKFLDKWATDWSGQAWMKVLLTQTIFTNLATLPKEAMNDAVVPSLEVYPKDGYAPNDKIVADFDSNGWPQTGRNKALKAVRKGFAFHLAGDQHLPSLTHYGVDTWNDAGFGFCVPAISNIWPRRWYPPIDETHEPLPGRPKYTGDFQDGFGNFITVHCVANPYKTGLKPEFLYDRVTGFGIVRFNRKTRDIKIECYARRTKPSQKQPVMYPDWPVTINQMDNYSAEAFGYLPAIEVKGMTDPVVQIIDDSDGNTVYAIRIKGTDFNPAVFSDGTYSLKVGDPDRNIFREFKNLKPLKDKDSRKLTINFKD